MGENCKSLTNRTRYQKGLGIRVTLRTLSVEIWNQMDRLCHVFVSYQRFTKIRPDNCIVANENFGTNSTRISQSQSTRMHSIYVCEKELLFVWESCDLIGYYILIYKTEFSCGHLTTSNAAVGIPFEYINTLFRHCAVRFPFMLIGCVDRQRDFVVVGYSLGSLLADI